MQPIASLSIRTVARRSGLASGQTKNVAQGGREDSNPHLENRPGGPPGGSRAAPTYALRVSAWPASHYSRQAPLVASPGLKG
jgi:hypothetical protein